MRQEIKEIYRQVPSMYGLALPQDYQHPKQVWFNPLYSGVGVLGYMGPFFAESQLNNCFLYNCHLRMPMNCLTCWG